MTKDAEARCRSKDIIRILHECDVLIEKYVPRVTVWHHEAKCMRDIFVNQHRTLIIDSFSCTPMGADTCIYHKKNCSHVGHFDFDVIFMFL